MSTDPVKKNVSPNKRAAQVSGRGLGARMAAWRALCEWEEGKGWVQDRLQLTTQNLSGEDRALAWHLALGVLRHHLRLQHTVLSYTQQGHLNKRVRMALELGMFQLMEGSRIPPHAAVYTVVQILRKRYGEKLVRLGNALLRRFQREGLMPLPPHEIQALALEFSVQEWLVRYWVDQEGMQATRERLQRMKNLPRQWVRLNLHKGSLAEFCAAFQISPQQSWRECWVEVGEQLPKILASSFFVQGKVSVQNPAAQLVIDLMDLTSAQQVWDVCAAPGGKSALILEQYPDVTVWATDAEPERLQRLQDLQRRLGLKHFTTQVLDAATTTPEQRFDRILIDAPCSNLGVLERRPEVALRLQAQDLTHLAKLQKDILNHACQALTPDGVLVYATCSPDPRETLDVVNAFLQEHPDWQLDRAQDWVEAQWTRSDCVFLDRNNAGLDGFFATRLRRKSRD